MAKKKKNAVTQAIRRPISTISSIDSALKFRIEESYKAIRTNLVFSIMKQGCKKVTFTSSHPSEGKTSTTVNIAITLASADYKVLLIDADLRKPKCHQYFSLHVAPGLTNYLGSMVDKTHPLSLSTVIQKTNFTNLFVLPAGSCPANPAELLASEPMAVLLQQLETDFDYILIDTPPINIVSDALPIIKQSDGVVGIIRANSSTYPEVDKMVQSFEFIEANVLGFVLTAVESDGKSKGYDDYGYYSYGTGRSRARSSSDRASLKAQPEERSARAPERQRPAVSRSAVPHPTASPQQKKPRFPVQPGASSPAPNMNVSAQPAPSGSTAQDSDFTSNRGSSYVDISSFDVPPRK